MARRARGEGSVTQRQDGTWAAVLSRTDPITKQRIRVTKYAPTKAEAARKLKELQENDAAGVVNETTSLASYLKDRWLPSCADLEATSVFTYVDVIDRYIIPNIGGVSVADFKPLTAEALLKTLRDAGTSARYVKNVYILLDAAMQRAVEWNLIARNPLSGVKKPKWKSKKFEVWSAEEVTTFLRATASERLWPLFALALSTGMRQGELLGLKWEDIDFKKGTLSVRRQLLEVRRKVDGKIKKELVVGEPKTDAGTRTIKLSPACISALTKQKAILLREGRAASEFVFVNSKYGTFFYKTHITKAFKAAIKAARVPEIRFHDLRHTNATLLIAKGTDIRTVAGRLGHADASVTLKIYAKFCKEADDGAAAVIGEILAEAI